MVVRALERIAATALLASLALPLSAASVEVPPRRVDLNKFSCEEFSAAGLGEERDRVLIYMNGYVDGTRKTTVWEAEKVGKRIDEVLRICKENPKLNLLDAFKRAWKP